MADLIGQRLGQYEIIALLGKGGMATVYRARQLNIERQVAIKVIKSDLVDNPDFSRRFKREAETLASLNHRHILKLFDYGQQGDIIYLVMELLTGGSLADLIEQGKLPPQTASRILEQIASALDYAHRRGIIHRDLKPHNVLLDEEGSAVLTDFGIVKLLRDATALTQNGTAVGTPAYMAPEQWRGQALDARTDIYALGIMLYEMLAGRLPFVGDTPFSMMHLHVNEPPPPLRSLNPYLPSGVEPVIDKALAKDPDQRFESASALAQAFKTALASQEQPQRTPPDRREPSASPTLVEPPSERHNRRALPVIGVALVALLIIGGVIAALLGGRGPTPTETPGATNPRAVAVIPTDTPSPTVPTATPVPTTLTPTVPTATYTPTNNPTTDPAALIAATRAARLTSTANMATIAAGVAMTDTAEAANLIASFTKTPAPSLTFTPTQTVSPSPTATPTQTAIPTSAILYQTDFEDGQAKQWVAPDCESRWQVITEADGNHVYQGSGVPDCAPFTTVGLSSWKDYAVELRFKRIKGDSLEIAFRAQNSGTDYTVAFYPPLGNDVGLRRNEAGNTTVFNQQPFPLRRYDWNVVHIEVKGDLMRASINGHSLPDVHDDKFANGYLGLWVGPDSTMLFDDIRVWALTPIPTPTAIPATAILYQTDFEDGRATGWVTEYCEGAWQVITEDNGNHAYRGSGVPGCAPFTHVGLPSWKDYAVELRFKTVKNTSFEITVRTQNFSNFYSLNFHEPGVASLARKKADIWTDFYWLPWVANDWNTIHIEVRGDLIRASVNGRSVPDTQVSTFASGYLGLIVAPDASMLFDDIRVWSP